MVPYFSNSNKEFAQLLFLRNELFSEIKIRNFIYLYSLNIYPSSSFNQRSDGFLFFQLFSKKHDIDIYIFSDVVRVSIPMAKEDEIRCHVSSCLAQAGDRDGGRKRRETSENAAEN